MYFYEVKPEHDGAFRSDGSVLMCGEIYTEREVEKYGIDRSCLKRISINPASTFNSYGARFYIRGD